MSEQPQNNPNYKQQHPNAIEDQSKAMFMAEAMDPHESRAIELRQELTGLALKAAAETDSYHHANPLVEMGISARQDIHPHLRDIKNQLEMSDRKARDMASIYDAIEATKR